MFGMPKGGIRHRLSMAVRGRPPSGSWSGVVFTDVRDCLLKSVGVPVKDWFAPYNFTKKEVSSSRFILREQQPQNLFLLCRWVALRRESR
jgi:hypothetical protein